MRFKRCYPVNHHDLIAENTELVWCKSNVLTNYNRSFMFCSSFMSCPINQFTCRLDCYLQIIKRQLTVVQKRSVRLQKEKKSTYQTYFNNPGYTLVILNESINKAINYWLSGMMESDRHVTDGNVSSNETTVFHVESFATRETNVRLSRLPHPPNEKWTQFV